MDQKDRLTPCSSESYSNSGDNDEDNYSPLENQSITISSQRINSLRESYLTPTESSNDSDESVNSINYCNINSNNNNNNNNNNVFNKNNSEEGFSNQTNATASDSASENLTTLKSFADSNFSNYSHPMQHYLANSNFDPNYQKEVFSSYAQANYGLLNLNQSIIANFNTQCDEKSKESILSLRNKQSKEEFKQLPEYLLQPPDSESIAAATLTATINRNRRRTRTKFDKKQLDLLEATFQRTHYPDVSIVDRLANVLKLNTERISIWFQNRRARFKRARKDPNKNDDDFKPTESSMEELNRLIEDNESRDINDLDEEENEDENEERYIGNKNTKIPRNSKKFKPLANNKRPSKFPDQTFGIKKSDINNEKNDQSEESYDYEDGNDETEEIKKLSKEHPKENFKIENNIPSFFNPMLIQASINNIEFARQNIYQQNMITPKETNFYDNDICNQKNNSVCHLPTERSTISSPVASSSSSNDSTRSESPETSYEAKTTNTSLPSASQYLEPNYAYNYPNYQQIQSNMLSNIGTYQSGNNFNNYNIGNYTNQYRSHIAPSYSHFSNIFQPYIDLNRSTNQNCNNMQPQTELSLPISQTY